VARLYFIRHGKAAAGFDGHPDPGLDETGRAQAAKRADRLNALPPMPIVSSPLLRARETADPLCNLWQCEKLIVPQIAEIPSPMTDLKARSLWLGGVMRETWANLDTNLHDWRKAMIDYLCGIDTDTVLFSHFIAINVAVGYANNDEHMISFRPDNASCTLLDNSNGLEVIELGGQASTHIN